MLIATNKTFIEKLETTYIRWLDKILIISLAPATFESESGC
jgi:hypothetical protein